MSWFNLRSHLKGYEVRKRGAVRRTIVSLVPGDIADVDEEKDDLPVDVEFEFVLAMLAREAQQLSEALGWKPVGTVPALPVA